MRREARRWRVEPSLILAVIHTESHFRPHVRSHKGAIGLMQLVPETGGRVARQVAFGDDSIPENAILLDPESNVRLGTAYLSWLRDEVFGDVVGEVARTTCCLAAYNAGPARVRAWSCVAVGGKARPDLVASMPWRETRQFIKRVSLRHRFYKALLIDRILG